MKIKQKLIHPSNNGKSQPKINSYGSGGQESHEPVLTSHQAYLPSEFALYRELVSELGLMSRDEQERFRKNLKEKYNSHLKLLQSHQLSEEKFRISSEQQQQEHQNKLAYIRSSIAQKQSQAIHRKQKLHENQKQHYFQQHQNWKQIIQKNKNQYLRNIKNSMKLIKRWENKLATSAQKRSQILGRVSAKMQEHNQYVAAVGQQSRVREGLEAEERILRMEEALSRVRTAKRRDGGEDNPEASLFKTPVKTANRQIKTMGSEEQQHSLRPIARGRSPASIHQNSRVSLSNSGSPSQLEIKQALDEEEVEQSLCKNIRKEKRIAEARYVKSYIYQQRNKQNRLKQSQVKLKILQNLSRIQEQERKKNEKLDEKFREVRKFRKLASEALPSSSPSRTKTIDKPSTNISLPIILNNPNKLPKSPQEYSSLPLKSPSKPLPAHKIHTKFNKIHLESVTDNHGANYLYLTQDREQFNSERSRAQREREEGMKHSGSESGKYDRKIMEKLRSLSLVANIKYKQSQQEEQKINQMRSLAYLKRGKDQEPRRKY